MTGRELATASPPAQPPSLRDIDPIEAVDLLDQKILSTKTTKDLPTLVGLREEIIKQNERLESNRHKRSLEKLEAWSKAIGRLAAVTGGIGIFFAGYPVVGASLLGVGLYFVAPSLVGRLFQPRRGVDND